ncbi:SprT-like domain-containing protein [Thiohalobacter sp. IOR34]|uniref:SprT family zinc-dependent metalloprotease n=1 Tax=Thiohalobacter sp. IOR34 TaxID=3057176 RepID=UPI0025B16374|nr:SprT-like domain-containing protein [Thiohalobacter sp. IOR34]WJW75427.1 SprT-like domain-containing protein [Thiohalobacter sp. IOR34]
MRRATRDCLRRAGELHARIFPPIEVRFDLIGRAAGMYRRRGAERCIRYNPYLFARYFEDSLANTVPHEVAHYVVDLLTVSARPRPHGSEWQAVMRALGVEPRLRHDYDLRGIPQRRQRQVLYRCACSSHRLGIRRHQRLLRGEASYHCRNCGAVLVCAE